ncbi:MAG: hypothetical protein R3A47_08485 [Polyangiales bacterium]
MPRLGENEALRIVADMLGQSMQHHSVRLIASIGMASSGAVEHAAYMLVSSGQIVSHGSEFIVRNAHAVSPTRMRLTDISLSVSRDWAPMPAVAEILSAALSIDDEDIVRDACSVDGLDNARFEAARDRLKQERLFSMNTDPSLESFRRYVHRQMSNERRMRAYFAVGVAQKQNVSVRAQATDATIGAYLCEGGDVVAGSECMLQAAQFCGLQGYPKAAMQLAAADPLPRER